MKLAGIATVILPLRGNARRSVPVGRSNLHLTNDVFYYQTIISFFFVQDPVSSFLSFQIAVAAFSKLLLSRIARTWKGSVLRGWSKISKAF